MDIAVAVPRIEGPFALKWALTKAYMVSDID
jgi:hypothetical protein